jgi:hypothetical protein
MAEVDLGVLSWSITASDEQLDTVLDSAAQKAQAWSARMRELTKVELQAEGVPEPVARPAGGPESRRPAPPLPAPPIAAPSPSAPPMQQFVQQTLAARGTRTENYAPEQQAALAQFFDPEGYRRAQREAMRAEAATRVAEQRQAQTQGRLGDRYAVAYENRLVSDRQRAQREAELEPVGPLESPQGIGRERFYRTARRADLNAEDQRRAEATQQTARQYERSPRTEAMLGGRKLESQVDDLVGSIEREGQAHDAAAETTRTRNREVADANRQLYHSTVRDLDLIERGNQRRARETQARATFEGEQFQERLEELPRRERVQAIRERMEAIGGPPPRRGGPPLPPGPDDPYNEEFRRLRRQEQDLSGGTTRNMLGRIGLIGAGYFAFRELGAAATEGTRMREAQRTLEQEGIDPYLKEQRQEAEQNTQGIGHVIRHYINEGLEQGLGVIYKAQPSGTFQPVDLAERLRRTTGIDFDDDARREAIKNAQDTRAITEQRRQLGLKQEVEGQQTRLYERGTYALGIRNPFEKERYEAATQMLAEGFTDRDRAESLRSRLQAANEGGNKQEAEGIYEEMKEFVKTQPERGRAQTQRFIQVQERSKEAEGLNLQQLQARADTERFEQAGSYLESAVARIRSQFLPQFGQGTGPSPHITAFGDISENDPRFKAVYDAFHGAIEGAYQDETRRQITTTARHEISQDILGHKPLEADLRQIRARADAARVGVTDPTRLAEIRQQQADEEAEAQLGFGEHVQDVDVSLAGRREQLQAGLARNPIGAEAIGIGVRGFLESQQLERQGLHGEARESLANTMLQENLLKQNYLDAFQGQAKDLRLFDVTNPRDVTDPAAVVKAIDDQTQRLEKAIADLGSD